MFRNGLLILTTPVAGVLTCIPRVLAAAAEHVKDTLYVHFAGTHDPSTQMARVPCTEGIRKAVTQLYSQAAQTYPRIDLRILIGNIGEISPSPRPFTVKHHLQHSCDVLLTNAAGTEKDTLLDSYAEKYFTTKPNIPIKTINVGPEVVNGDNSSFDNLLQTYDNICLGGTFDRIHTGHKILLSEASVLCNKRLIVGVTEGPMNNSKSLPELMESCEARIKAVQQFLEDIKPQLIYEVVPITDPFGPSITDPDIQCIVVSEETLRGGNSVNRRRLEKGMTELAVDIIGLVEDSHHLPEEEDKISSSSQRQRLLGSLVHPVQFKRELLRKPYIIGLTGGIASGKSSVCKRLEALGAAIVDCDKLGHKVYEKDGPAYAAVVDAFGSDILTPDGNVDRKILGSKVFSDPEVQLKRLNNIMWPAIKLLAEEQIDSYRQQGQSVVVLDAAVLLEANWDVMAHEVWTTIIPKKEAIKRIGDRNNLAEEEATRRIEAQLSNQARVDKSNVVLCTLWDYPVTQKQVEKAWRLLQERLPVE